MELMMQVILTSQSTFNDFEVGYVVKKVRGAGSIRVTRVWSPATDTVGMSIYTVSTIGAINAIYTVGCLGRTTHTSVFDTDHFVTVYGGGR